MKSSSKKFVFLATIFVFVIIFSTIFNVIEATGDLTPVAPKVEGSHNVIVGENNTYIVHSDSDIFAEKKNESMFAGVLFAIKKVFAQTTNDKVMYIFDWNSDGITDNSSGYSSYGAPVPMNHIWSAPTTVPIQVAAKDLKSGKISSWTSFAINAINPVATTIVAPTIRGEYCTETSGLKKATIIWNAVSNAAGYNIYKVSSNQGSNPANVTLFQVNNFNINPAYTYHVYAYRVVDSDIITSDSSNVLTSDEFYDLGACSAIASVAKSIKTGFKFYSNPNWASSIDSKCNFYGYGSPTIVDRSNTVYSDVVYSSCYVDKVTNIVNVTPTLSLLIRALVGKHTLYCDITYNGGIGTNGKVIVANKKISMESKCSNAPNVLEK